MNVRFLIDQIVQQTTVLIAQLATAGGVRAPLGNIANQVFLSLVNEFEAQGVGRKVIADMFGLALRSYQLKVQRLSEGATDSEVTLWQAVYDHLQENKSATRQQVLDRFRYDEERAVRSVLNDLVASGLLSRSGRGREQIYRLVSDDDVRKKTERRNAQAQSAAVWVTVYRCGPVGAEKLMELLRLDADHTQRAIKNLLSDGRIRETHDETGILYTTEQCHIPLKDGAGWEAALFDHFQSVVNAIALKVSAGRELALPRDEVGGSTYAFDIWPGHPFETRVRGLLARMRKEFEELSDQVDEFNQSRSDKRSNTRVTFYFGQALRIDADEPEKSTTAKVAAAHADEHEGERE